MNRETLGHLNSNDANRRHMATPGHGRSQSSDPYRTNKTHGYTSGTNRQDHRPLKDPVWRRENAQKLVDYAARQPTWPIDRSLDVKLLCMSCPPSNDVFHLLGFLIEQVDPNFPGPLDGDAITTFFKRAMKYPYNLPVSKNMLQITPLTWHFILGAMVWLVERIEAVPEELEGEQRDAKAFTEWVAAQYSACLWGHTPWENADDELKERRAKNLDELSVRNRELQHEHDALENELAEVDGRLGKIQEVFDTNQTFLRDISVMRAWFPAMENLTRQLREEQEALESERKDRALTLEWTEKRMSTLNETLATQVLSKKEEEKLIHSKTVLNSKFAEYDSRTKHVSDLVEQVEKKIGEKINHLEELVVDYNRMGTELRLCPGGKHGKNIPSKLEVNRVALVHEDTKMEGVESSDESEVLTVSIKQTLVPAVQQLRHHYQLKRERLVQERNECERELRRMAQERSEKAQMLVDARDELAGMEQQHKKAAQFHASILSLERELARNEQQYASEKASLYKIVSEALERIKSFKNQMQHKMVNTNNKAHAFLQRA